MASTDISYLIYSVPIISFSCCCLFHVLSAQQCPNLMKDLISSTELEQVLGKHTVSYRFTSTSPFILFLLLILHLFLSLFRHSHWRLLLALLVVWTSVTSCGMGLQLMVKFHKSMLPCSTPAVLYNYSNHMLSCFSCLFCLQYKKIILKSKICYFYSFWARFYRCKIV